MISSEKVREITEELSKIECGIVSHQFFFIIERKAERIKVNKTVHNGSETASSFTYTIDRVIQIKELAFRI